MGCAAARLSAEAFLEWAATQDGRYELVDGRPVATAPADARHDRLVVNILLSLGVQLRGSRRRPFTAGLAIGISNGNIRCADAGVQCASTDQAARTAAEPTLVAEVFSRASRAFDQPAKLDDYKRVPTLAHVLLVDPETPDVIAWSRGAAGGWVQARHRNLDAVIDAPSAGVRLSLADIYDGVALRPG